MPFQPPRGGFTPVPPASSPVNTGMALLLPGEILITTWLLASNGSHSGLDLALDSVSTTESMHSQRREVCFKTY